MSTNIPESTKKRKLEETHENNLKISRMNLKDKFSNFETTLYEKSNTLLFEVNKNPKYFKRYGRGRVVKVRFGVNEGSEFSGDHFAIVISKKDTAYNPVLHVIPLSSKEHKRCVNVGNALILDEEIENLKKMYTNENNYSKKNKIKKCLKYYSNRDTVESFALIEHMKTISKLSIKPPINEYDYINKIRISEEILREIDRKIIEEFTK